MKNNNIVTVKSFKEISKINRYFESSHPGWIGGMKKHCNRIYKIKQAYLAKTNWFYLDILEGDDNYEDVKKYVWYNKWLTKNEGIHFFDDKDFKI